MEDLEIPDESMRHIEALLARHRPEMIQRMFQQTMDSRRSSNASSLNSSAMSITSIGSSFRSGAPSFRTSATSSYSRLSMVSNQSTSTLNTIASDMAPSIASSSSSISNRARAPSSRREPRSYPSALDPTRPAMDPLRRPAASHTPTSDMGSPLDTKHESGFTPPDEDMSVASFPHGRDASQSGESYMFCTYCAETKTSKTFKAKSDWKKHEMRMHETGEDWPCVVNGCNRIFDRQKDFLKHHQRYHSGRPLPSLTDIGIRLLPRRVFGCGFDKCKEVSIGWDERCDHVAKHMKNGYTFDQWKYSTVIRNLIRQEALHDAWKEIVGCLDERLRESRSQISWCPDNTRILRQKLQCCDLRPSREEVLITALSLRSDITVDPSEQPLPPGFVTPSIDSVPNVDKLSREQRMHILIGNPNASICFTRLAAVNTVLLRACHGMPEMGPFDVESTTYEETTVPADTSVRPVSYMDIDSGDNYLDLSQAPMPPDMQMSTPGGSTPMDSEQTQPPTPSPVDVTKTFDPTKPANPLGWCYPNYFDTAPSFEESPYYDRPTIGQMISKPLQRIGSRLSRGGTATPGRPTSQPEQPPLPAEMRMSPEYPMQMHVSAGMVRPYAPPQQPLPPPPPPFRHDSPHHYQQQHLHLFTSQN